MFVERSPFERLRVLLGSLPPGRDPIDLSIGSPAHAPPAFVAEVIQRNAHLFGPYPPIAGTPNLRRAMADWLDRRYRLGGLLRERGDVLPLSGSREGLVLAAVTARDLAGKPRPTLLFANPFYAAYPAAAHAIGATAVPLAAADGILPDFGSVAEAALDAAVALYVASPSNPEGRIASAADWHALFDRAERHGFLLFADECYSEIWRAAAGPPLGALEAAKGRPEALDRLLVFNSLSKRSNLAGLRAGLVAGGRRPVEAFREYRNQAGPQLATPLQEAAAAAWDDEAHVVENRRLYDAKFADAEGILGVAPPPGGFFLWLPADAFDGDDEAAAVALWRDAGVRALPGSYLALTPEEDKNPGRGFVRLALVADATVTREALGRVAGVMQRGRTRERDQFESVGGSPR
jgi:aspartate/methionine/tyrosine aminotransferase